MTHDGAVHFPEEQLTTYLRVFMPKDRIDDVLDQIAQAAIESEVDDEMELFALAHWLMDADDRRSDDLEAAVLVEEVGLPLEEVAFILDLEVADVRAAVASTWAELDVRPSAVPEPGGEPEPVAVPVAVSRLVAVPGAPPAARGRVVPWLVVGLVVLGLGVLAGAMFSAAGQARLNAVGLDPVVALLVVVGFIGGGTALLKAGGAPGPGPADPSDGPAAPSRR